MDKQSEPSQTITQTADLQKVQRPHVSGSKGRIVVVDDDNEMRELLVDHLVHSHHEVKSFSNAQSALDFLGSAEGKHFQPEVVISDIQMPQISGIQLAEKLRTQFPEMPIILVTAFGSIESAIDAMRKGAFDYVTKPFKLSELSLTVERAIVYTRLQSENRILRGELTKSYSKDGIIGKSKAMQQLFDLIDRVAAVSANVLITGESGTGKEVVARTIHNLGPRTKNPFVAVNCSAIPDTLLESELFGHAKGSFTGAFQRKKGLFEEAHTGTLFLDEIGDMDIHLQAKLLRVIQEKKIRPVGDNVSKDIDVRIIAATHKDLKQSIKQGLFREDLYYRLSVIPVSIPALRSRRDDIPLLANFFLRKFAATNGIHVTGFSQGALQTLMGMKWEGNVRELENMVERMVVMSQKPVIQEQDIPLPEMTQVNDLYQESTGDWPSMEQLEKRYIQAVLEKTGGKKDKAAHILGINRRTLYRKEREFGLVDSDQDSDIDFARELESESSEGQIKSDRSLPNQLPHA